MIKKLTMKIGELYKPKKCATIAGDGLIGHFWGYDSDEKMLKGGVHKCELYVNDIIMCLSDKIKIENDASINFFTEGYVCLYNKRKMFVATDDLFIFEEIYE